MKIELDICETQLGQNYIHWTIYEDSEVQDSGVVANLRMSVEDMVLTAIGDIFHTTTPRISLQSKTTHNLNHIVTVSLRQN